MGGGPVPDEAGGFEAGLVPAAGLEPPVLEGIEVKLVPVAGLDIVRYKRGNDYN